MAAKMERTKYPGIYKRGSRYVITWRDRGVQRKESFRTLAEAREAKGRRQNPGERRAYSNQRFAEYAEAWLESYNGRTVRGIEESTRDTYRKSIERFAIPYFGRWYIKEIEPPEVRAFVRHLADKGCTGATLRRHLVPLKALFATAYEDGHIRSNPTLGVRLNVAGADGSKKVRALSKEELGLVLAAVPDEWRPFFTFLVQTGLRISEATGLQWHDLDLGTTPCVNVRRQFYDGKLKKLKTPAARRTVPLTAGMTETLLSWRADNYAGEYSPVWPSSIGSHMSSHNIRSRVLKPATKDKGLEWVGFHTFRHTYASILFAPIEHGGGGKNVKQVQQLLGHTDPQFTMRTYVHLTDGGVGSIDFLDALVAVPVAIG